ncbi:hypothetical protein, partial [Acetomicrobium sp. S15 = DSM 107314]|uniref:hypothetical protein n=1 Tax=Acetomicrobium sp. S15 = DSM 107314 TaxID=2529858 RepID=UPI0018E1A47E
PPFPVLVGKSFFVSFIAIPSGIPAPSSRRSFLVLQAVQQESRPLGSCIQDVVFLYEGELVTSHEVGLLYHVSRPEEGLPWNSWRASSFQA